MSDFESFVEQLTEWHESRVAQLQLVLDHPECTIKFQADDGTELELSEEQAKGFRVGVQKSLDYLGKLPFTVTPSDEEE